MKFATQPDQLLWAFLKAQGLDPKQMQYVKIEHEVGRTVDIEVRMIAKIPDGAA